MRIVILAAGYGTRLYPLTKDLPKPLIPINGKPIISFLMHKVEHIRQYHNVRQVRIVSNNKFYKHFLSWKRKNHIKADVLNDGSNCPDDRLGAIGDIKFAVGRDRGDWLIIGGDNLFEDDLLKFLEFARKNKPYVSVGLYDLNSRAKASRYGVVKLDKMCRIKSFKEKPKHPASTLVASCVYFFPARSLNFLRSFLRRNTGSDASGKYIAWLVKEAKVFGYILGDRWLDVGHRDSLVLARKIFKS